MSKKNSQQVKYLTVSAMLCALGIVILGLGAVIEVLDITVAVIASLLTVYAVIEIGGAYPWLIWIVTSTIALLLLPLKTPVLFYALLTGYYPIIKQKIERRMARLPAWAVKIGVLAVSMGVMWAVMWLFAPALLETTGGIVQGMSGSPIIQNGKLVGAVTHVLVNDPTTGYGIFIENMLDAAA